MKRKMAVLLLLTAVASCGSTNEEISAPALPPRESHVLPPRPREVPLGMINACSLLTPAQIGRLDVGSGSGAISSDGLNSPACIWSSSIEQPGTYLVRMVTGRGAEFALGSSTGSHLRDISGFSAVETSDPSFPAGSHCLLFVDVAANQNLVARYDYDGAAPITPQIACDRAAALAEMAVQTLIEQSGG